MVFVSFILIFFILLISALFCGDIGLFINWDSAAIVLAGTLFFTTGISVGRFGSLQKGLKEIISFKGNLVKDKDVRNIFGSMVIGTIAIGLCSTIQGIIAGVLSKSGLSIYEIISIAAFSTVYALLIALFLFYPVYVRNK